MPPFGRAESPKPGELERLAEEEDWEDKALHIASRRASALTDPSSTHPTPKRPS